MARNRIEELNRVTTLVDLHDIFDPSTIIPKGSAGTVVTVHDNYLAYCVEFTDPLQALADAEPDQIQLHQTFDEPDFTEEDDEMRVRCGG